MKFLQLLFIFFGIVFCLPVSLLYAQDIRPVPLLEKEDRNKIIIEADSQITDSDTGVLTATGNVKVIISARGIIAKSRQAQYFRKEELVVLTGDVSLIREGYNFLKADRVVYMFKDDYLVADSTPTSHVISNFIDLSSPFFAPSSP